eukprot:NODE_2725_length_887_cov_100.542067.p2 GENE.NODE_2725_length_887_cov_100.542067~~NODE_2725_length_887_cov_100.542067.p2  ORF type:complete len:262 (-),score=65.29 NODE_2725_length_887_cov_100.542067:86-778(-)
MWQHVISKHEDEAHRKMAGAAAREGVNTNSAREQGVANEECRDGQWLSKEGGDSVLLRDKPAWWTPAIDGRMARVGSGGEKDNVGPLTTAADPSTSTSTSTTTANPQEQQQADEGDGGTSSAIENADEIAARVKYLREVEGVARIWPDEGFYACPTCGQSVPLDWSLLDHLDTLKPLLGVAVKCRICDKAFIEHRALKQHLNHCARRGQRLGANMKPRSEAAADEATTTA